MNKKLSLILCMLLSIQVAPLRAIQSPIPEIIGLSLFGIGTVLAGLDNNPDGVLKKIIASGIIGAVAYYLAEQCTPDNKFDSALAAKNKVERNQFFKSRTLSNVMVRKTILNNFDTTYPFLSAVASLHTMSKSLKCAYTYLQEAPQDMSGNDDFRKKCKNLAEDVAVLQREIEKYAQRIMRTVQWYKERQDISINYLLSHYIDSVKWSTNLIEPEASITVRTRDTYHGKETSVSYSFSPRFVNSLEDWDE